MSIQVASRSKLRNLLIVSPFGMDADDQRQRFEMILDVYKYIISQASPEKYAHKRPRLRLPVVPSDTIRELVRTAKNLFAAEPNTLKVSLPVTVIGDLHGHILDLFRILGELGFPPDRKYLFLGDFIDRGDFSTETITIILLLKVLYPEHVFLIRGNHEFAEACVDHSSFFSELYSLYTSDSLKSEFFEMFSFMPLAANVEDYALAVHGGIGPSLFLATHLNSLRRPLEKFEPKLLEELLWSDPSNEVPDLGPSTRGLGCVFGVNTAKSFLSRNDFSILVRGHQCVNEGVSLSLDCRVITVFSASNYCGDCCNNAGALVLLPGPTYEKCIFEPLPYLHRYGATYVRLDLLHAEATHLKSKKLTMQDKSAPTTQSMISVSHSPQKGSGDMGRGASTSRTPGRIIRPMRPKLSSRLRYSTPQRHK